MVLRFILRAGIGGKIKRTHCANTGFVAVVVIVAVVLSSLLLESVFDNINSETNAPGDFPPRDYFAEEANAPGNFRPGACASRKNVQAPPGCSQRILRQFRAQ